MVVVHVGTCPIGGSNLKTVGVIGVTETEIVPIRSKLDIILAKQAAGFDFCMGKLFGKNVVTARCGFGKVNAAVCTQIMIDMYGVDYVISMGAAGAAAETFEIGDMVISSDAVFHDFDINPSHGCCFFAADAELVDAAKASCMAVTEGSNVGRIATGDQLVLPGDARERIAQELGAACVETVGAAVAQTCHLNNIPFVLLRSISDKMGSARMDLGMSSGGASDISARVVEDMLHGL